MIYEENNSNSECKNDNPSKVLLFNSREKDEFIFGCHGNDKDYNLIKLDSNFEIESIVNKTEVHITRGTFGAARS